MKWKIAYRNLFRNRRRTLATGTAIAAGFVGLTLLGGYILRVENGLKANSIYLNHRGHLSIYKAGGLDHFSIKPSKYQITGDELKVVEELVAKYAVDIEFTGQAISGAGLISNGVRSVPYLATGVDPQLEERLRAHPLVQKWAKDFLQAGEGSFAEEGVKNPQVISITKKLGELLGRATPFSKLSPEKRSVQLAAQTFQGDLNAVNAELMVTHTTGASLLDDTSVWAPIKKLQELYGTDGIHFLAIYLKDESALRRVQRALERDIAERHLPFEVFNYKNEIVSPNYVGSMGFINTMSGFFVFLICGAVALSIVNSLTMGILERTKELGTLRAMGFLGRDISVLFAQEAVILTTLSVAVGGIVSLVVAIVVNSLDVRFSSPGVATDSQLILAPDWPWILSVVAALLGISITTGFVVSRFKLKARVIDLLSDAGA